MSGIRDHAVYLVRYTIEHRERTYTTHTGQGDDYIDAAETTRQERNKLILAPSPEIASAHALRYTHNKPELVSVEKKFVLDAAILEQQW